MCMALRYYVETNSIFLSYFITSNTPSLQDLTVRIPKPVLEGNEVTMSCTATCSNEDTPHVIWRKDGQELPGEKTTNTQLKLMDVSPDDEGNYSCALKDHGEHPSKPVKLNVMGMYDKTTASV